MGRRDHENLGRLVWAINLLLLASLTLIYQILKEWLIWPSAEQVKSKLPKNYPAKYTDIRIIMDYAEFFIVKPKNCSAQASTYSQHKLHNTVKVLIGITPRGLTTFVSNP